MTILLSLRLQKQKLQKYLSTGLLGRKKSSYMLSLMALNSSVVFFWKELNFTSDFTRNIFFTVVVIYGGFLTFLVGLLWFIKKRNIFTVAYYFIHSFYYCVFLMEMFPYNGYEEA